MAQRTPRKRSRLTALVLAALAHCAYCAELDALPLNHLQFLGSHNSYRLRTHEPLLKFLLNLRNTLPDSLDPRAWDYEHAPIPEQLTSHHIRALELDIYHDPAGGAFAHRQGNRLIRQPTASGDTALNQPGFKILHFPDFDYRSSVPTLRTALDTIAAWSRANPSHEPLIIHLETKDDTGHGRIPMKNLTQPPKWDTTACDSLDAEIRATLTTALFTPDHLRGQHASLSAAARAGAWPALAALRGRILVVIEGCAVDTYRRGHTTLAGRACFIYGSPGRADTAFLLLNNPRNPDIPRLARQGYLIRTRADSETREARTGDTTRREAALASGAHIISTDYYRPDPRAGKDPAWTGYSVQLPGGGPVRKNPVTAAE